MPAPIIVGRGRGPGYAPTILAQEIQERRRREEEGSLAQIERVTGVKVRERKEGEILSIEEIEAELDSLGVNVDDPVLQSLLRNEDFREQYSRMPEMFAASLRERYPKPTTTYEQYKDLFFPSGYPYLPERFPGLKPGFGRRTMFEDYVQGDGYVMDRESGAILYVNGVLVIPDLQSPTGATVLFPEGDADVPGSMAWLQTVRKTWGPEEIKEQKKILARYGYLPKGSARSSAWTLEFSTALREYYINYYQNLGQPTAATEEAARGAGAGVPDLSAMNDQIALDVMDMYRQLYGVEPSEEETAAWTRYIINRAESLVRRKDVSPDAAIQEAQSEFLRKQYRSPAGRYMRDVAENTSLRDGIENAIIATRMLFG